MNRYLATLIVFLSPVILLTSCGDQDPRPAEVTDWTFDIESDAFQETNFIIRNLEVTSTDGDIVTSGKIRIADESGDILLDDYWINLEGKEFVLSERREYLLQAELYVSSVIDTKDVVVDNIKYPSQIIIQRIVSDIDFSRHSDVSESRISLVEVIDWNSSTSLFSGRYPPRTSDFNTDNELDGNPILLDLTNRDGESSWYIIEPSYARVYETIVTDILTTDFTVQASDLIDLSNFEFDKTYEYRATSSGYSTDEQSLVDINLTLYYTFL